MENFTKETCEGLAHLEILDGEAQVGALVAGVADVLSRHSTPDKAEAVLGTRSTVYLCETNPCCLYYCVISGA